MMKVVKPALVLLILTLPAFGAEYKGNDIDGESFTCTAYSYGTSKYYDGECETSGSDITFTFSNGKTITVTLDDEEIDDPENISAFDYLKSVYWDFDVDLD